jgi:hypothetical protein
MLPSSVSKVGQPLRRLAGRDRRTLGVLDQALRRGRILPGAWRDAVSPSARLLTLQVESATYADAYLNDVLEAQGRQPRPPRESEPTAWADLDRRRRVLAAEPGVRAELGRLPGVDWWTQVPVRRRVDRLDRLGDTARGAVQAGCTPGQR